MPHTSDDGHGIIAIGVDRADPWFGRLASLHGAQATAEALLPSPPAGVVAVVTCHRLELYLENVATEDAPAVFRAWLGGDPGAARIRLRDGHAAATHLLRVAAGLESAVLGEDQILGQLRAAYRAACSAGRSGPLLHKLFHAAFRAGRRVRSETALGAGTRSLAGAAVATLHRRLDGLPARAVLVLGAGQMGALAARLLAERRVGRLLIANRTYERAVSIARPLGAEAVPWEWRRTLLSVVDAVICATRAPGPVLDLSALRAAAASREHRLVVVDLSVPCGVEEGIAAIDLFDLDRLAAILDEEGHQRAAAIHAAETIVHVEGEAWLAWRRAWLSSGGDGTHARPPVRQAGQGAGHGAGRAGGGSPEAG